MLDWVPIEYLEIFQGLCLTLMDLVQALCLCVPLVCPHHQIHHGEKLFLLPYIRSLILDKICHAPHQYSQSCSGSPDTAGVNMGVLCPGILPYLADLTQLSLAIHCASQPQAINPGMVTKNPFTAFIFH